MYGLAVLQSGLRIEILSFVTANEQQRELKSTVTGGWLLWWQRKSQREGMKKVEMLFKKDFAKKILELSITSKKKVQILILYNLYFV